MVVLVSTHCYLLLCMCRLQEMFSDDLHEAGRIPRTIDCELTCDLGMTFIYSNVILEVN